MSELSDAALEYAKQGYYIFPIKPNDKAPPLIKKQYENSSRDLKQVRDWWSQFPDANIGLDCGKCGLDVIDVDAKHNGIMKTMEALKLISGGKDVWDTRTHKTPGGGFHYIFSRRPLEDGVLVSKPAAFGGPGIDTRTSGGYIVLPPSTIKGNKYTVVNSSPVKNIPKALLSKPGMVREVDASGRTELETLLASNEPIRDGARNATLQRVASKLLRIGLAEVEVRASILSVNKLRCIPPLPEDDVIYLVKKQFEYFKAAENIVGDASKEESEGEWNDQDQTVAVNIGTFLDDQEEGTTWLWDNVLPTSSLNMIQGNPKSGKSTMTRHLSVAAAIAGEFLDISFSTPVPVLYYSLQENKKQWKTWLTTTFPNPETQEKIRVMPMDVVWRLGRKGPFAVKGLRERILTKGYKLVIIDMISRFLSLQDSDKYAQVEGPLSDMNDIAQETGACILWLHHERKSGGGFEAGIGSQAFRGAVYTTIKCERKEKLFAYSTEQREGDDVEETNIVIKEGKLCVSLVKPWMAKAQAKKDKRGNRND